MQLLVTMQSLGRKRPLFTGVPFPLTHAPATLRDLLTESVTTCVAAYNARLTETPLPTPMTDESLAAMETVGKLAFGMSYNATPADLGTACQTALEAFTDGLVRVFHGQQELTNLDAPLSLPENAPVTFIRLTFLTGGIF